MSASQHPELVGALRAGLSRRYAIERELGAGGMAVVFLAEELQHSRRVALKVFRSDLGMATGAERFHREIKLAARLVHPHILPLLASGEVGGLLWYTMPFIEGESLRARIDREKLLAVDEAIRLSCEVAEALGYAHAQGILHRDIKPENILLSGGHALVADFGIARAIGQDARERITSTGVAVGTPAYMSPEQWSGDSDLDARSDLYALGCVSYEMLAGEPPFTGPTAQAVIARRLAQPPPSLRSIRPQAPEWLDAALRRALAPLPADRFASTADFARALSAVPSGASIAPRPARRWPLAAGVTALFIVVAGALWLAGSRVRSPGPRADDARAGLRLAVLPFRLISRDTSDIYLAAGMTEEVTSTLSTLGGLRVIARTSVVPSAGSTKSARAIGAALGADVLVEGTVQKAGDVVRVRVQLIDAQTEESKWSQEYDHTSHDMFQVQSEVASKVAGVLRIQLAERESRSLQRPPTTNPEAYDQYLRARARSNDRANLDSAITGFTRAVQLDSTFASAWALLATSNIASVFLYDAAPGRLDRAEEAIRRALALDSTSAMAWKARHDLEWNAVRGWHFTEALADARHALTLQPSLVAAHTTLGSLYFHYGFMEEARRELEASLLLDPRDGCDDPTRCTGFSRPRVARVQWYQQQFDSALATYRKTPYLGDFVWELAVVLNAIGRSEDGLALLDTAKTAGAPVGGADSEAARALLLATLGRNKEAEAHMRFAIAQKNGRSHFHHAQFTIACAYARMGRKTEAIVWLRETAENGMPNYPLFRHDPNLRSLQGEAEYEALMTGLKQQFEAYGRLVHAR